MANTPGGSILDPRSLLAALGQISDLFALRSGQREILSDILGLLERNLGMIRGTIMLLALDGSELLVEALGPDSGEVNSDTRYAWGEGITGKVVANGRSIIVPRVSVEPLFRDRIHQRKNSLAADSSFICVPICIDQEVVGTLSVDIPLYMSSELLLEERFLSVVAGMIAHYVKNLRDAAAVQQLLEAENLRLRQALGEDFRPEAMVGTSKEMREVYARIRQVCMADTTVLIRGESGTGKELVASSIHYGSSRAGRKMVKVNCAALNENLLESELFGHERGAFTGATTMRVGRIEDAEGGTLFLDEIGEIAPSIQVKLLRFLQEREFERVGSNRTIRADVRIIGATNRNLEHAVASGDFRQDLYYRINVFPIHLPPLREHKADILALVNSFTARYSSKLGKTIRRISTPAISAMMAYDWPGNIRELENCIEHAVIVAADGVIHGYNLPPTLQMPSPGEIRTSGKLLQRVEAVEREMITDALKHTDGRINAAALQLGITPRMMRYKIKNLDIDYKRYFSES